MPGGYFFSILFFVLLAVAALTSAISILEVVVAYFTEDLNISRKKATIIATVSITLIGTLTSLAQGPFADVKIFGLNFFDLFDWITANLLLPLGGLFISLFVGWVLSPQKVKDELSSGGKYEIPYFGFFMIVTKIIAPIGIAIVFLNGIGLLKI
jgi:NSS family neurotransmitter:Na+ symporter